MATTRHVTIVTTILWLFSYHSAFAQLTPSPDPLQQLDSANKREQLEAIKDLKDRGRRGAVRATHELLPILNGNNTQLQLQAIKTIKGYGQFGKIATQSLINLVQTSPSLIIRKEAAEALILGGTREGERIGKAYLRTVLSPGEQLTDIPQPPRIINAR